MLSYGVQITAIADSLTQIGEEELLTKINSTDTFVHQMTEQLKIVRSVDEKQYGLLKKRLPYFVCGHFNPAIRRTENFTYIDSFVLDIDHISSKGLNIYELKQKFRNDDRVSLFYVSPSQDGIKLLFHLKDKCYDTGIFSLFYRTFSKCFSQQYGLEQVMDVKTSDVTRACFISYDREAYYNPLAEPIILQDYIDTSDTLSMFDQKRELESTDKTGDNQGTREDHPVDPDDEALKHIKEILLQKKAQQVAQQVYVPEQVNAIMDQLKEYLQAMEIHVDEIIDISYGKKIRTSVGLRKAETNVFYGKKGYSVVISPKSGTSQELNEMVAELIKLNLYI